jgi:hypothetical protein
VLCAFLLPFSWLARQIVGFDLFRRDADTLEAVYVGRQMLAKLTLKRNVDKHPCWVTVPDVENHDRTPIIPVVDIVGSLIGEREAGEDASGVLLAVVKDDAGDRARFFNFLPFHDDRRSVVIGFDFPACLAASTFFFSAAS